MIHGDKLRAGWGVIRLKPWHLAGIFTHSPEAEALARKLGDGYVVKYGDHEIGTGTFVWSDRRGA